MDYLRPLFFGFAAGILVRLPRIAYEVLVGGLKVGTDTPDA